MLSPFKDFIYENRMSVLTKNTEIICVHSPKIDPSLSSVIQFFIKFAVIRV